MDTVQVSSFNQVQADQLLKFCLGDRAGVEATNVPQLSSIPFTEVKNGGDLSRLAAHAMLCKVLLLSRFKPSSQVEQRLQLIEQFVTQYLVDAIQRSLANAGVTTTTKGAAAVPITLLDIHYKEDSQLLKLLPSSSPSYLTSSFSSTVPSSSLSCLTSSSLSSDINHVILYNGSQIDCFLLGVSPFDIHPVAAAVTDVPEVKCISTTTDSPSSLSSPLTREIAKIFSSLASQSQFTFFQLIHDLLTVNGAPQTWDSDMAEVAKTFLTTNSQPKEETKRADQASENNNDETRADNNHGSSDRRDKEQQSERDSEVGLGEKQVVADIDGPGNGGELLMMLREIESKQNESKQQFKQRETVSLGCSAIYRSIESTMNGKSIESTMNRRSTDPVNRSTEPTTVNRRRPEQPRPQEVEVGDMVVGRDRLSGKVRVKQRDVVAACDGSLLIRESKTSRSHQEHLRELQTECANVGLR